jgi:ABC-type multidrug transport system fused ATPase/permease subunit
MSRWRMVVLSVVSLVAGLLEASLLALIATVAGALSQGRTRVDAHLGLVSVNAEIRTVLLVGIGVAVVRGVLQTILAYLPATMSASAMSGMRQRLFDAYTDAEWGLKATQRDGHLQSLMNAHVSKAADAIVILATGITSMLMFVTLLSSAFALSVATALVLIGFSLVLFIALRPLSTALRRASVELSAETMEYTKGVQEVVLMAEETEVFGATPSYRASFHTLVEAVRAPQMKTRFLSRSTPALYQSIALLLLVLALMGVQSSGLGEIATLGAVVLILVRSLTYGQQVQTAVANFDQTVPFIQRLADAIDDYAARERHDGGRPLPPIRTLAFEDVRFTYPTGTEVLHGVGFEIAKGEAIGIAGPSGAGKSSIVQLLLRLRDASDGTVTVNGEDVRQFRRTDWQRRVAYVPQSPQLVWGTVADNIRFYRPELTDEDIERAARMANIDEEIRSWPAGYGTVIGQRAAAVSGGQRQRICLARALAARPEILVLDEATSSLDVRSEAHVRTSLERLKGDVTLVIVGHRLSILAVCDRVMVVIDGRIQDFGPPGELVEASGFYREVTDLNRRAAEG